MRAVARRLLMGDHSTREVHREMRERRANRRRIDRESSARARASGGVVVVGGGGGGGGGGRRGRGGGGGGGGAGRPHRPSNDGDFECERQKKGIQTAIVALAIGGAHAMVSEPSEARGARGTTPTKREEKLENMATAALYGFVFFYAIKMALKRLFAPMVVFAGTTQLLYKMRAVQISPTMMYERFVKPYVPVEYRRSLNEFGDKATDDTYWKKQEKRFFACAHRILPASDSPMGERALLLGILLAGLTG